MRVAGERRRRRTTASAGDGRPRPRQEPPARLAGRVLLGEAAIDRAAPPADDAALRAGSRPAGGGRVVGGLAGRRRVRQAVVGQLAGAPGRAEHAGAGPLARLAALAVQLGRREPAHAQPAHDERRGDVVAVAVRLAARVAPATLAQRAEEEPEDAAGLALRHLVPVHVNRRADEDLAERGRTNPVTLTRSKLRIGRVLRCRRRRGGRGRRRRTRRAPASCLRPGRAGATRRTGASST